MKNRTIIILMVLIAVAGQFSAIYFHELTHKFDFRNFPKTDDRIMFYPNCEKNWACYVFFYDDKNQTLFLKFNEINKHTELRAFFVSFIILSIMIFLLFFLKNRLIFHKGFKDK